MAGLGMAGQEQGKEHGLPEFPQRMDALNWSVKHLSQTIVMDKFGDILEIA